MRAEFLAAVSGRGVCGGVVNGTCCEDWAAVAELTAGEGWLAAYGIHPWHIEGRPADWLKRLRGMLEADTTAGVGEVGLDLWVAGADLADQVRVFEPQLDMAAELNRPLTIHCLRAWDPLLRILKGRAVPQRGFLVHAFNGSAEVARELVALGARFSFSTAFVAPERAKLREVYWQLPLDRLLVETDAPAMPPPPERSLVPLEDGEGPINHPLNIAVAYEALAELRGLSLAGLAAVVAENYKVLFVDE